MTFTTGYGRVFVGDSVASWISLMSTVHFDITVEVELPEGVTRDEITDAAEKAHGNADDLNLEYNRTLDKSDWVVRDAKTGDYL